MKIRDLIRFNEQRHREQTDNEQSPDITETTYSHVTLDQLRAIATRNAVRREALSRLPFVSAADVEEIITDPILANALTEYFSSASQYVS